MHQNIEDPSNFQYKCCVYFGEDFSSFISCLIYVYLGISLSWSRFILFYSFLLEYMPIYIHLPFCLRASKCIFGVITQLQFFTSWGSKSPGTVWAPAQPSWGCSRACLLLKFKYQFHRCFILSNKFYFHTKERHFL